MKTFYQYLQESTPMHQNSLSYKLFHGNEDNVYPPFLPVTSAQFNKVLPDHIRGTVFHVANVENAQHLMKMQNKNKSLSTSFKTSKFGGIGTQGGAVYELDANLLAAFDNDIFSIPDKSGRRWVDAALIGKYKDGDIWPAVVSMQGKLFDKYKVKFSPELWEYFSFKTEYRFKGTGRTQLTGKQEEAWNALGRMFQMVGSGEPPIGELKPTKEESKMIRKELSLLIKDYFDGVDKIYRKHKDELSNSLRSHMLTRVANTAPTASGYDEIIVDNFIIKKVHLVMSIVDDDMFQSFDLLGFKNLVKHPKIEVITWDNESRLESYINKVSAKEKKRLNK